MAHDEMLHEDSLASADEVAVGASERAVVMNGKVGLHVGFGEEDDGGAFGQALAALPGGSVGGVVGHCGYDRRLYDCTVSRVKQDYQMREALTEKSYWPSRYCAVYVGGTRILVAVSSCLRGASW